MEPKDAGTNPVAAGDAGTSAMDIWLERTNELKEKIEVLLETQLCEYELLTSKLEEWKKNVDGTWLTMADYEPWQTALKALEEVQREFDAHFSKRPD